MSLATVSVQNSHSYTFQDSITLLNISCEFPFKVLALRCNGLLVYLQESVHSRETVCGSNIRESLVYTTMSNVVEIRFVAKRKSPDEGYFLMKYEGKELIPYSAEFMHHGLRN